MDSASHRALETKILDAHAAGDVGSLIEGYGRAAVIAEGEGDIDAACFFATYAYIYALEAGHPDGQNLHEFLKKHGREE